MYVDVFIVSEKLKTSQVDIAMMPVHNKKFELMLTRCAKVYSSYWPTMVK